MKKDLFVLMAALVLVMVGCGSKPTLSKWVKGDDIAAAKEEIDSMYAESGLGLHVQFSADGEDVLVFSYIYDEYRQLAGYSQSEIDATFADELNRLGTGLNMTSLFEECEKATGIALKRIRVQCVNADGTVIYSQDYMNTK